MKALITIIILALVAWGIWWLVDSNNGTDLNTDDTTGQVNNSLDDIFNDTNGTGDGADAGTTTDETSGFDDKG